jgi:hypothetical protein
MRRSSSVFHLSRRLVRLAESPSQSRRSGRSRIHNLEWDETSSSLRLVGGRKTAAPCFRVDSRPPRRSSLGGGVVSRGLSNLKLKT